MQLQMQSPPIVALTFFLADRCLADPSKAQLGKCRRRNRLQMVFPKYLTAQKMDGQAKQTPCRHIERNTCYQVLIEARSATDDARIARPSFEPSSAMACLLKMARLPKTAKVEVVKDVQEMTWC
jgi:hypothetical protein